jgi:hypothetical protein
MCGHRDLENRMDKKTVAPQDTLTNTGTTPVGAEIPDLGELRLSQNFAASIGVKKALLTVPVRKPGRQDYFRVHPDPAFRLETAVLELKDERETYLVDPALWPELAGELIAKVLFLTVNRQKVTAIWPVRLPGEDGRVDTWSQSAMEAAQIGMENWIRVVANMSLNAYEVYEATVTLSAPEWPSIPFADIVRIAFKGRYIKDLDHPVVRRLRGES